MDRSHFSPLVSCLERELAAQRAVAELLDTALDAARSRNLTSLDELLQSLDATSRRVKALSAERDALLGRAVAGKRRPSLRELAEAPDAPASVLLQLRVELRDAVEVVFARSRRLQAILRELGEVYGSAIGVLIHGRTGAHAGGPADSVLHGSLVNTEA